MSDNLKQIMEYAKEEGCLTNNRGTDPASVEVYFKRHYFIIYTDVDLPLLNFLQNAEIVRARLTHKNVFTCLDSNAGRFILRTEMQKATAKRRATA